MSTITFDTHRFVSRLREAGFDENQAEAVIRVVAEAQEDLATKRDLADVETRLKARIDQFEAHIAGEVTLMKWMLGVVVALAAANFAKQFF
jgi:hypothetical protein